MIRYWGMSALSWGIFVALASSAIFIALGVPLGPLLFVIVVLVTIFAFRYTYTTLYFAILLIPFLGLTISIPTGELAFGKRAFGGSIDISVAEAVLLVLLIVWALKIILLWFRRHDTNWRPRLPLVYSYASLVAAHLVSAFSPLQPDPILVIKYSLRPVLFCYLAFVALPVNLLRSRRRIVAALSCLSIVGTIAALNGAVSLFFVDSSSQFLRRAHPLPMFGVPALGDNHNLLAELLAVTVMMTLALFFLTKKNNVRRILLASAMMQFVIGLLTFSRTVWIVFALQALALGFVEYRHVLRRHLSMMIASLLILIPFALVMVQVGLSNVAQSSTSTRYALLEIAAEVFTTSPWLGGGAGTFVDRVGSAQVFRLEYGEPLDSHGLLQKLAAETGVAGLIGFLIVAIAFTRIVRRELRRYTDDDIRHTLLFLVTASGGAVAYQLFNTNYWTGKMWLPVGLTLAAFNALSSASQEKGDEL
jgi:predicted anti-sigma-YlaC factor YlaD